MVRISTIGIVLAVLVAAAVASVTSNDASARPSGGSISLVAYSTPRDAYAKLIPAFTSTSAGSGTSFQQSYGASGEQARAVIAGLKADVVAFSIEPDMTSLVKAKLVAPTWKKNKWGGIVTRFAAFGRELLYLDRKTFADPAANVRGGNPVLFPSPGSAEVTSTIVTSRSGAACRSENSSDRMLSANGESG